ncbi:MAG: hypothetical protein AB1780_10215 [Pseudomonadota bacterium]
MVSNSARKRNIVVLGLLGIAVACAWGYSKYHYAKSVADEIDALAPFANEKIELIAVEASDKHFTLQLSIAGVHPDAENIQALKAYYDDVAVNYVCSSEQFKSQFEDGYRISLDISYLDQPELTFKKTFVAKEQCGGVKS